ncbi:MAG: hypothetical protein HC852_07735 [Acaryochloridaceae cyanobacterium RU_4_10]|nr:hypothetical protein [Acaryochloridaceae cyanobacterium RU_4_10]
MSEVNIRDYISQGISNLKQFKAILRQNLIRIPTNIITDEFAFSLAPEGWNFYRDLVFECSKKSEITLENTTFFQFFQSKQLNSVCYLNDLLFIHDLERKNRLSHNGFNFYLGTYPWGGWTKEEASTGGKPFGHHYDRIEGKMTRDLWGYGRNPFYKPKDRHTLECELKVMQELYPSLKKGYYPLRYGFPSVTLLVRQNGEMRAVMGGGHHRLSILSHLGYERLTVLLPESYMGKVFESEVAQWYYVSRGLCTPEQALEIFNAYFDLNGRERLAYLGLTSIY